MIRQLKTLMIALCCVVTAHSAGAESYRYDSRFAGFSVAEFLLKNDPSLLPWAEEISHFSGHYSVSPLAIIAVMQAESVDDSMVDQRLAGMVAGDSVGQRIEALAAALYRQPEMTIQAVPHAPKSIIESAIARLERAANLPDRRISKGSAPQYQLPTPFGQAWQFNGVHTNNGSEDGTPMSAIDLAGNWNQSWGQDVSEFKVTAAHAGTITVLSECFVMVTHSSGYQTGHYHLDNIAVSTGQEVQAGEFLAEYANSLGTALCLGGHSQGPHLHFSLRFDGEHIALDGEHFSGYRIHAGTHSYDSSPTRMWLDKDGGRFFAYRHNIFNDVGGESRSVDFTYNGMWYQPELSGHGLNLVVEPAGDSGAVAVFVTFFTYDDNDQANYYTGNVEVGDWSVGTVLTLPLLQTRGGGFSDPRAIDFSVDTESAGELSITLHGCNTGSTAYALTERSTGVEAAGGYDIEKLIGVPVTECIR